MTLYARYVDSKLVGGWYVDTTEDGALAMAQAAIATIDAKWRYYHSLGGGMEVGPAWIHNNRCLLSEAAKAVVANREPYSHEDEHSWDFSNVTGL